MRSLDCSPLVLNRDCSVLIQCFHSVTTWAVVACMMHSSMAAPAASSSWVPAATHHIALRLLLTLSAITVPYITPDEVFLCFGCTHVVL